MVTRLARSFLCLVALLFAGAVQAQTFPKFTGFVVDAANVLPPAVEADLNAKLDALQRDTHRQLVVATIPDLQGYPLEDYGYRLGRAWGVGLQNADNGAILFIAPNNPVGQRGPRLEVGSGLEPRHHLLVDDHARKRVGQHRFEPVADLDTRTAMSGRLVGRDEQNGTIVHVLQPRAPRAPQPIAVILDCPPLQAGHRRNDELAPGLSLEGLRLAGEVRDLLGTQQVRLIDHAAGELRKSLRGHRCGQREQRQPQNGEEAGHLSRRC